jgi:hypothetical protein
MKRTSFGSLTGARRSRTASAIWATPLSVGVIFCSAARVDSTFWMSLLLVRYASYCRQCSANWKSRRCSRSTQ